MLIAAGVALSALAWAEVRSGDWLLYNNSPSLPIGFYVRTAAPLERSAIVTARAADVAPDYAAERSFTGPGDRFIKRIAALESDRVCASADTIEINRRTVAHRAPRDSQGRVLPRWNGCRVLQSGEYFLLGDTADSFDGRYFGIVSRTDIEGVWRLL